MMLPCLISGHSIPGVDCVKVLTWGTLTLLSGVASYLIYKFIVKRKKHGDAKNFGERNYVIGAAVVNMERAMLFGDDENFKFFARFAIRTCLGMVKAYPPDEPSMAEVKEEMTGQNIEAHLIEQALEIYTIETLPEDSVDWKDTLKKTRALVRALSNQSHPN